VKPSDAAGGSRPLPRSLRKSIIDAVDQARREGRFTGVHEPLAVLAARMAGRWQTETETPELVRLSRELRFLLAALPLATPAGLDGDTNIGGEGGGGGDSDDDASPSDLDRELADLLGSGPTMGDPPNA
jgi:hypothetical protein